MTKKESGHCPEKPPLLGELVLNAAAVKYMEGQFRLYESYTIALV